MKATETNYRVTSYGKTFDVIFRTTYFNDEFYGEGEAMEPDWYEIVWADTGKEFDGVSIAPEQWECDVYESIGFQLIDGAGWFSGGCDLQHITIEQTSPHRACDVVNTWRV